MKVDETEYAITRSNDDQVVGVIVTIERGAQTYTSRFITDDVAEEFGRVSGTMINTLSLLEEPDADGGEATPAVPVEVMDAIKKAWRGIVHD